jgi:hypothetical protein
MNKVNEMKNIKKKNNTNKTKAGEDKKYKK